MSRCKALMSRGTRARVAGIVAVMAMALASLAGATALFAPRADAANCITMITQAYESRVKPASECNDVNVNEVRKFPLFVNEVQVWGQYRLPSGEYVNAKAGPVKYQRGVKKAQWPAIKSLKPGTLFRMRANHRVEFVLRV